MARDFSNVLQAQAENWNNTYDSISGVDIKAVLGGITFGNLQAISYSITREKVI